MRPRPSTTRSVAVRLLRRSARPHPVAVPCRNPPPRLSVRSVMIGSRADGSLRNEHRGVSYRPRSTPGRSLRNEHRGAPHGENRFLRRVWFRDAGPASDRTKRAADHNDCCQEDRSEERFHTSCDVSGHRAGSRNLPGSAQLPGDRREAKGEYGSAAFRPVRHVDRPTRGLGRVGHNGQP